MPRRMCRLKYINVSANSQEESIGPNQLAERFAMLLFARFSYSWHSKAAVLITLRPGSEIDLQSLSALNTAYVQNVLLGEELIPELPTTKFWIDIIADILVKIATSENSEIECIESARKIMHQSDQSLEIEWVEKTILKADKKIEFTCQLRDSSQHSLLIYGYLSETGKSTKKKLLLDGSIDELTKLMAICRLESDTLILRPRNLEFLRTYFDRGFDLPAKFPLDSFRTSRKAPSNGALRTIVLRNRDTNTEYLWIDARLSDGNTPFDELEPINNFPRRIFAEEAVTIEMGDYPELLYKRSFDIDCNWIPSFYRKAFKPGETNVFADLWKR